MADTAGNARIAADALEAFVGGVLAALEVPPGDAARVALLMVLADLNGYDTHGVFRLRQYVNRLRDGGFNAAASVTVAVDKGAVGIVDGDNGLGHLAVERAADLAIQKADRFGIGWVGVRNGNHAGPASLYVNMVAERDMIGVYGAVSSANRVPPFGGVDLLLGSNPIAVAVPAGDSPPFVLDMATTVAAVGKIKALASRGEPMPVGWVVGQDGQPLTDPNRREEGFLLPIGGPKGYGLAMAIGLMAGTLNGAAFGSDVVDFSKDTSTATNTGQFVLAVSVADFVDDVATFKQSVDRIFDEMRASETLPGHDAVRIPGEGRPATREERRANGIPLHASLVSTLNDIAAELRQSPLR